MRPRASKERGTENESSEEEGATRFWRMTFRPVAVLASVHSTQFTTAEIKVLECMCWGRVVHFSSSACLGLAVFSGRSVGAPCSQSQVGNGEQQANVAQERVTLRGCDISILGDFQDLARLWSCHQT